jgi:hypothetical protein
MLVWVSADRDVPYSRLENRAYTGHASSTTTAPTNDMQTIM